MAQKEIINIVSKYKESLSDRFDILSVYIFGSYSKETYSEDSDIDVAVIVKNSIQYDDEIEIMKLRRNFDLRIEPHIFSESDFDNPNPLINEIKRTGIII